MKKIIALFCLAAILLCVLASCNGNTDKPVDTSKPTDETTPPGNEFSYETSDNLDPNLDYNNEEFRLMTWNTQQVNEWIEEVDEKNSAMERAFYTHLVDVEERLNLEITLNTVPGRYDQMNSFITTMESTITAGISPDLICQYSLTSSIGMIRGLYGNLLDAEHLDFDAPWWNKSLVEGNTINNSLYYISGDLTPTIVYNMYGVLFNKDLLNTYSIEAPYTLVKEDNWTYSRMLELIKDTAQNADKTEYKDGAVYGLVVQKLAVDAFQTGFGISAVQKNQEGKWALSSAYSGSRSADIVETLRTLCYSNNDVFYDKDMQYSEVIFGDGNALFDIGTMGQVERAIRDREVKTGIVPIPKYDEEQENYATRLAVMVSMFSVPKDADMSRSSAVLEALGSDGYKNVTPVVFENTFQGRYSDAPEDADMFKLIRDSIVYDPGNTLNDLSTFSAFRNCVYQDKAWTTFFSENINKYAAALKSVNELE